MNAPSAFPRLNDICEKDAPSISPPFALLINNTCCGADTANKQPVHIIIQRIDTIGLCENKNIKINDMLANN